MNKTDICIIGAGVIGLAVARELADTNKSVVVLERNDSFGRETSSRNSEVIHAGMYYPAGTLKAKMCVEGRQLLYEICEENNIPHRKIGKLIVAVEKEEVISLDKLYQQGKDNDVNGLRMLTGKEMLEIQPGIPGFCALYSEETGIIDSHLLMQYFLSKAKESGAIFVFCAEVMGVERASEGYRIKINNQNESVMLETIVVINCAGLDSDNIAQAAGINLKKHQYELHYCKGQYFRVNSSRSNGVKKLIYPVPKPKSGGLGIHITIDLGGAIRLGPDDKYLDMRQKDYTIDETRRSDFYASAMKVWPFLKESDLTPDTAGIRPKLQAAGGNFRDFVIAEESQKGLPGFINLIGIESPGLTASAAIAKYVKTLIKGM